MKFQGVLFFPVTPFAPDGSLFILQCGQNTVR